MNKIFIIIAIGLTILINSCKVQHIKETITYKDTTIVRVNWKDTTIVIPKQIAQIDGLKVYLDSLGRAQLNKTTIKSGKAFVEVGIKDNILSAKGGCDSLELVLKLKETEIQRLTEIAKTQTKTIEVKHIPSIYHFFKWWSILTLLLLGLYIFTPLKNLLR